MKIFTLVGLIFNTIFFILFALAILGFVFNVITPLAIFNRLVEIQQSFHSRLILGLTSLLIVLVSLSFAQSVLGKMQREKNIAFTTAGGEVSIALLAVEDLIKRLILQVPEVRSLRPDVVAGKKGIVVNLWIDLRSETNIPDLTERLQELVRNKINDTLRGIDTPIYVKIHVAKIVFQDEKKKADLPSETKNSGIPFYGYGR